MTEIDRKLLIVEDDPGLQRQLKWCFDNYEVITAGDRAGAIAELRRHEPPVVLQDLGLPPDPDEVKEGFETLDEILGLAPVQIGLMRPSIESILCQNRARSHSDLPGLLLGHTSGANGEVSKPADGPTDRNEVVPMYIAGLS